MFGGSSTALSAPAEEVKPLGHDRIMARVTGAVLFQNER